MAGYHVIRIAIDPLGQPISAGIQCFEHLCGLSSRPLNVGPFDTADELWQCCRTLVDFRPRLFEDHE